MGCVNFGVISMWIVGVGCWVCFFTVFFFFGWMLVSILLHSGRLEASILREMVADDGGCVGCVGSMREIIVLKK